ncbi:hypothetical protein SKAU_G00058240 [Synaphobranchus kaupii]|uniref:Uncharacterized protein n=1 Tax=Synaphobranchus kaupii TaxID=118154 RepID=A0A9Q1G4C0_SYNKA|nr:hypothetical protein SKAU_G00058240 [Synaphobranchus kaupii]
MDGDKDRPEHHTAFVANELKPLNIDVAALSETRFPDEGQLCEENAGYSFFWKDLLNHDAQIDPNALDELEQHPVRHELAEPPTLEEVVKALKSLKNAYSRLGLTLNINKTEVLFQHERGYPSPTDSLPAIQVNAVRHGNVTYRKQTRQLETYHQRCLRQILCIKWQDKVTNATVLKRASTSLESTIPLHRLRWVGHIYRMSDSRLQKQLYYSQLSHSTRPVGALKKQHTDLLKHSLQKCGINPNAWNQLAADRQLWRSTVRTGVQHFENTRLAEEAVHREQRKAAAQ